ncbi:MULTISPECIES: MarR family winged helix-turn-helix transcriptional regulator [unclassified Nocardia]|uniref:MarR family winged helix-turn-helix transcriptional regulator n=1 Tax=unclassified Nocardia TaxID=2637762 RepID=UPI001CE3CCB1|nr:MULTISPECIES: MarR family winged helix-turn-helix transcriptional regulator [unclassified Nocardia]
MSPRPTETHPDGGPALFRLVRFWSRRWVNRTAADLTGEMREALHVQVVEAIAAAGAGTTTITGVAHQLGLDHSGASRMVRDAVAAGYVARAPSESDRRSAVLRLTARGRRLLADAHEWQRTVFDELTADWSETDRRRFADYLQRISNQMRA